MSYSGPIVMDTPGSPVYVILVAGVLHIQTRCCGEGIVKHGDDRVCMMCTLPIRNTPRWVSTYILHAHEEDTHLVKWLSFWTGVEEECITVEVKL